MTSHSLSSDSDVEPSEPDASGSDHSSVEDASVSEDSGGEDTNGFLDMEASESDGDGEEVTSEGDDDHIEASFPQFVRLPIEIRQRIWELFCPDLTAKSRVVIVESRRNGQGTGLWPGSFTDQCTAAARAVLATHHESRVFALKVLPDELVFGRGHFAIRFNKEVDVILMEGDGSGVPPDNRPDQLSLCSIKHFAIRAAHDEQNPGDVGIPSEMAASLCSFLRGLRHLYVCVDDTYAEAGALRWCASALANRWLLQTFELEPGLGEDLEAMYCWPDVTKGDPASLQESIPVDGIADGVVDAFRTHIRACDGMRYSFSREQAHPDADYLRFVPKIDIWPMIVFEYDRGMRRFRRLEEWNGDMAEWDDEDDGEGFGDGSTLHSLDEYESEGIDDGDLEGEGDERSDEEDSDLMVLPLEDGDSSHDGEAEFASFSSPEPEPGAVGHEADSSSGVALGNLRGIKRRIVASDSEDDSGAEGAGRKPRPVKRRVIESDSEDDSETEGAEDRRPPTRRRTRVISSESEDEDNEEGGAPAKPRTQSEQSSGEEESEEEDEEAVEEGPAKRLSLAERLRIHREQNPVPSESESDGDEMGGGEYAEYAAGEWDDDEEGDDPDGDAGPEMGEYGAEDGYDD